MGIEKTAITVINVHGLKPADLPQAVYVGRPIGAWRGSSLGNPFVIDAHHTRERVIELYRNWLTNQMKRETYARIEIKRLAALARQGPLVLACWCAPEPCHANVIKQFIQNGTY